MFPTKFVLAILASIGFLWLIVRVAGPNILYVPMESIKGYLPRPHIVLTMGSAYLMGATKREYDIDSFVNTKGDVVPLTMGTCKYCMGSPTNQNPHYAVAFEELSADDSCHYNLGDKDLKTCFRLRPTDVIVIRTKIPKLVKGELSLGVYLFDKYDSGNRNLLQAPLYDPLRFTDAGYHVIVVTFLPELGDYFAEFFKQNNDVVTQDVSVTVLPIPSEFVSSGLSIQTDDRISILIKSLFVDDSTLRMLHENTHVSMYRVDNADLATKIGNGVRYMGHRTEPSGASSNYEKKVVLPMMLSFIDDIKQKHNVQNSRQLVVFREITETYNTEDCIVNDMNCLAEDWDLDFSISGPLVFPEPPSYKLLVVGIAHNDAHMTTLSLIEPKKNQQVYTFPLMLPEEDQSFYHFWMAADCRETPSPCLEIPNEILNMKIPVFLRERVYGIRSYEGIVSPFILKIKE